MTKKYIKAIEKNIFLISFAILARNIAICLAHDFSVLINFHVSFQKVSSLSVSISLFFASRLVILLVSRFQTLTPSCQISSIYSVGSSATAVLIHCEAKNHKLIMRIISILKM